MRLALIVVLATAALLRLWGLGFGLELDDPSRSVLNNEVDEHGMATQVATGLREGSLHPGEFLHRGPGGYLVFAVADLVVLAPRIVFGDTSWDTALQDLARFPALLQLIHRGVSALAGFLTVLAIMALTDRLGGRRAGLLAGALLAVAYVHVRQSHYGTVDTLWALLVVVTLERALSWSAQPTTRGALLLGVLGGAAAAVKYFGVLLGGPLLLAWWCARRAGTPDGSEPSATPRVSLSTLGLLLLGSIGGFALLSPIVVLAPGDLFEKLLWSTETYGSEPAASELFGSLAHHARFTLWVGLGEPVVVFAVIGLLLGLRAGGEPRQLALSALLLTPSLFLTSHHPVRFGLPVAVLAVPFAGVLLDRVLERVGRPWGIAVLLLALAPSLVRSVAFDALIGRTDTRVEIVQHLRQAGAEAEDVYAFGIYGLPRNKPKPYVDVYRASHRAGGSPPAPVAEAWPRFLLRDLTADGVSSLGWDAAAPLVGSRYREVVRLDGRTDPTAVPMPDPAAGTPSHFVPYAEPWTMRRPGPGLVLYERLED